VGRAFLELGRPDHDQLPVPRGNVRVAGSQVSAGDLQVNGGLLLRLIPAMKQPGDNRPVFGAQARLFAASTIFYTEMRISFQPLKPESPSSITWKRPNLSPV
jgi:hypothetical protein